jgi:uncharacterized protein
MNSVNFDRAKKYAVDRLRRELPPGLFYHGLEHTRRDVVPAVELLAAMEGIDGELYYLLLTAAWFHDLGFIEERIGHELASARLASEILPDFGYTDAHIKIIKGIIMATVLPQSPGTISEKIMADADLDVLGRDDFMLRNDNLRLELAYFGQEFTDAEWYKEQLKFLEGHTYFTLSARALRDAGKLKNITDLKRLLEKTG